ncbi:hypothetical protein IE53DRAFT_41209 [Violaceomyces palustris]|uniref:Uncharacterized protein n=1 Tax=Violaceomyces palustris TaxID=1673888 RepID=A0ACD0P161_9BASI|nr:hypothetical protein IE53DRAFT_41209 [Violaceomyces palustris]
MVSGSFGESSSVGKGYERVGRGRGRGKKKEGDLLMVHQILRERGKGRGRGRERMGKRGRALTRGEVQVKGIRTREVWLVGPRKSAYWTRLRCHRFFLHRKAGNSSKPRGGYRITCTLGRTDAIPTHQHLVSRDQTLTRRLSLSLRHLLSLHALFIPHPFFLADPQKPLAQCVAGITHHSHP